MTKATRYEIIKHIFRDEATPKEEKEKFLDKEIEIDFSDVDTYYKIACFACLPELEGK